MILACADVVDETFNYYVDPTGGSDGAGTGTKASPWATLTKAFTIATTGQGIGVKRGTVLRESAAPLLGADRIRIGAYGVGVNPIISGGKVVSTWTLTSGNTYSSPLAALPTSTPVIVTSKASGAWTLLVLGTGAGTLTANQWFWAAGLLYVNLGGTNPNTTEIELVNTWALEGQSRSTTTLRNLTYTHCSDGAVSWIAGGNSGHIISRCRFQFITMVNFAGSIAIRNQVGSVGSRISRCVFDQIATEGVYIQNTRGVEIDRCTITNAGGMVSDQQTDGIQFEANVANNNADGLWIHDNTITMGATTVKGCIVVNDNAASVSQSGIIENNRLIGAFWGVAAHASNLTVRKNTISDQAAVNAHGIWIDPAAVLTGISLTYNLIYNVDGGITGGSGANSRQVTIAHNTIVDAFRSQVYFDCPIYGLIKNNIAWNTGANPVVRTLYVLSVAGGQTLDVDYNLWNTEYADLFRLAAAQYATLAAWRAATGWDTHSLASSNPLFTNAGTRDYTLQTTSPAKNAGVVIAGINQVAVGVPDIGRYEFGS